MLALAAMPALALPLMPHRAHIARQSTALGNWRLDIARNAFSGGIACRLASRNARAFYRAGAVGFRFPSGWDVGQAVYRLDGAAPRVSRDDLPRLVALGAPIDRGPMDNASEGIVWVPYEALREANSIAIAPRPDRAPRTFHFRGLAALHDIAVERGCTPESRFVER